MASLQNAAIVLASDVAVKPHNWVMRSRNILRLCIALQWGPAAQALAGPPQFACLIMSLTFVNHVKVVSIVEHIQKEQAEHQAL